MLLAYYRFPRLFDQEAKNFHPKCDGIAHDVPASLTESGANVAKEVVPQLLWGMEELTPACS